MLIHLPRYPSISRMARCSRLAVGPRPIQPDAPNIRKLKVFHQPPWASDTDIGTIRGVGVRGSAIAMADLLEEGA
jgi:hypothetical protein